MVLLNAARLAGRCADDGISRHGDINPSKMPGKKVAHRKDSPQDVDMYAKAGKFGIHPTPPRSAACSQEVQAGGIEIESTAAIP
jgi:hypothetical protein